MHLKEEYGSLTNIDSPMQSQSVTIPNWLSNTIDAILSISLLVELVVMFGNVLSRLFFHSPFYWSDEVGKLCLTILTFIGGAIAYPRGEHAAVRYLIQHLSSKWQQILNSIGLWLVLLTSVLVAILAIFLANEQWSNHSMILGIGGFWYILPIIIGMTLFGYFAFKQLRSYSLSTVLWTGIIVITLGLLAVFLTMSMEVSSGVILLVTIALFLLTLVVGMPIAVVLPFSSIFYIFMSKSASIVTVPTNMQNGISSFLLLSIPFFVLAGYIMTIGGLNTRLADFLVSLIGNVRGGLYQVVVLFMYLMSGVSGSKVADVASVGMTMKGMLRERGYDDNETVAVLASSAVMGETVPPSMQILVLGSISTLSIGALFVGGIIPAAVIGLCVMILIYFRSLKRPKDSISTNSSQRISIFVKAIPALLAPVILIGGIVGGIATPTEVSSAAVVYSLLIAVLLYREMSWKSFWGLLSDTATKAGMVLFTIGAATPFSWSMTIAGVPQDVASLLGALHGNRWLFMIVTVITLVVMGSFLEGLPALIILAPILLPMATQYGIEPLQYGVVLIVAMGLGAFIPPLGIGFFVTSSICDTTVEKSAGKMIPYIAVLFIGILLVAFIPWFTMFLPHLMGMK
jgi:tripartite ATP-independent transporter DctM subunit